MQIPGFFPRIPPEVPISLELDGTKGDTNVPAPNQLPNSRSRVYRNFRIVISVLHLFIYVYTCEPGYQITALIIKPVYLSAAAWASRWMVESGQEIG